MLFSLRLNEIKRPATGEQDEWCSLVTERRLIVERGNRRRQVPRILLSDGQAFYEGAVVGVFQATTRLYDGQRIRVDGNSGKIVVLE